MRCWIGGIAMMAVWLFVARAQATLTGFSNVTGANSAQITTTPPNPVMQNPNDGILLAWNEQQNLTLSADLAVDRVFDVGASFVESDGSGGFLIKAGTVISSHYLQWDPGEGSSTTVNATVNLDGQAFAFITADQKLFDSDPIVGLPGLDYNDFNLRGLESQDTTDFNGSDVDISWTASSPGDWTRLITAFSPLAAPELTTNDQPTVAAALDFGLVRVGTSQTADLLIENTGGVEPAGLSGTVPSPSGAGPFFLEDADAFGPLTANSSTSKSYRFSPTTNAIENENIGDIASNDTDGTSDSDAPVSLNGQGVGPVADFIADRMSINPGETLDFGNATPDDLVSLTFRIANMTTDPNDGNSLLTDLSLHDLLLSGDDASRFRVTDFTMGSVVGKGDFLDVGLTFAAEGALGTFNAMLGVQTDVAAAFGGDGEDYSFNLTATSVPEPTSIALIGMMGGLFLSRFRSRNAGQLRSGG